MSSRELGLALVLLVACGGQEAKTRPRATVTPEETPPVLPAAVDTLAPASVTAGDALDVRCVLRDEEGNTLDPGGERAELRVVPEGSVEASGGELVAVRAGAVTVACAYPGLALADATPAPIAVRPAAPAYVLTELDRDAVTAGDGVLARCSAVDRFGNAVDVPASLLLTPAREGNEVTGLAAHLESAGSFLASCEVPGAQVVPAPLEVRPALPAKLVVSLSPAEKVYARGSSVRLQHVVADRYGNEVDDAPVRVTAGGGQDLGEGRFRFLTDGHYRIDAAVDPPTEADVPLEAHVEILVDSTGPSIACDEPANAAILELAPGGEIDLRGSVADASGVERVLVGGVPVPVAPDGTFTRTIGTVYGINAVDVAAVDVNGVETARTCSFLVADQWAEGDLQDAITFRLGQAAIDDGSRTATIDSLADILQAALNSGELQDTIDAGMKAANPVKPSACDEQVCVFGACVCVLRSRVDFVESSLPGPNTTRLTLVDGGMSGNIRFDRPALKMRVQGHVAGIPYDTTGWVTFSSIAVNLVFDLRLDAGRPRMSVRPGSVQTTVGTISTDFSGLDGAILEIVASLASGTLRDMVRDLITSFVRDGFNSLLDGVLSGLDLTALGSTIDVPRLDGGSLPLTFAVSASSLSATSTRDLFGLSTRFSAPAAHARPGSAAPLPPGPVRLDPEVATPLAVAIHVGMLGQAMHALWRGGFLDATLDPASMPDLPPGITAGLATELPPAVALVEDRVELGLGAVRLRLAFPALFTTPVDAWLASRLSLRVSLREGALSFDDMRVDDLHLSLDSVNLDATSRAVLEDLLATILQDLVGQALQGALPSLPVPSFALPAELTAYGLPANATLGLTAPALDIAGDHLLLTGGSGIR